MESNAKSIMSTSKQTFNNGKIQKSRRKEKSMAKVPSHQAIYVVIRVRPMLSFEMGKEQVVTVRANVMPTFFTITHLCRDRKRHS